MSPWSDLQPRHGSTGWTRLDAPLALITMIAASPAACFDLSLNVHAHTASMGPSGERAVAGVTAGLLSGSDTVTWEARHFGIPFRMTSKVDEFERPLRFVDYQVGGPFGRWWHEHLFEAAPDGGTCMRDHVIEFRSPLGPIGDRRRRDLASLHAPPSRGTQCLAQGALEASA